MRQVESSLPFLLLIALLLASGLGLVPRDAGAELLYVPEGNRLRRFDVDSIGATPLREDVLVRNATEGEQGEAGPSGRDVNGLVCPLPDDSGRFVAGEDTGQPDVRAGWGVFEADGTQVGKLTPTAFTAQPEPFGCAFDGEGRLFTTEVGDQGFGASNGQLILWFPPFDRFPGAPGSYPNGELSTDYCKIATDIGTATGIAIADDGSVLVSSSSSARVLRFASPFPSGPDAAGGCGRLDATGAPLADADRVNRSVFIQNPAAAATPSGLARTPTGGWAVASVLVGKIAEFDADGSFVRMLVEPKEGLPQELPASTGHPQSLAFDASGTLYYVDLDLRGPFINPDTGPNGKLWRVRFDPDGNPLPPQIVRQGLAFPDGVSVLPGALQPAEWRSYGAGPRRLFANPDESRIDAGNVARLVKRWEFPTGAVITASPSVALVDLPDEGPTQVAYVASWDETVYAVRVRDGSEVWSFHADPQPCASFPAAASVDVSEVDDEDRLFVGVGASMYSLDARTGQELWRFLAGTGDVEGVIEAPALCTRSGERNEIESSVLVADGTVFFGMDVNDNIRGTGGFYAVDARRGTLEWFFDLESGQTCRPDPNDAIVRFDGYHSEEELGLPSGFSASRSGCDFPRRATGCGNVWSSPAGDLERGLLFVASSNCDTDLDPETPQPTIPVDGQPVMPAYDEAIFALGFDGTPAWRWRPREVDNADLAFGATANLFTIRACDRDIDVLGVGNKDGTYYVLDRDGANECTGARWDGPDAPGLPYWSTNVVPGGDAGGIIGSAAVDEAMRRIHFGTAPQFGDDLSDIQRPTVHTLDMDTGTVLWQNPATGNEPADDPFATFSPTTAIPGVVFTGQVPAAHLRAYDAATGERLLRRLLFASPFSAVASAAAVIDGTVLVGTGIGTRTPSRSSQSDDAAAVPSPLVALCVPGSIECGECQDGVDNDGDGYVDRQDPGCDGLDDSSELSDGPGCDNGLDDDEDGAIDANDPGCPFPHSTFEDPACNDGIDNDGDGLIDFDGGAAAGLEPGQQASPDPICSYLPWPYWEAPPCGLGAELLLVVPLLRAGWRRRRPRDGR